MKNNPHNNIRLASQTTDRRIEDSEARHNRNLKIVTALPIGALAVGLLGGPAINAVFGGPNKSPAPTKVANLTKEQAKRTTLIRSNVDASPFPQAEVERFGQIEVPVQNGEGTWGLAKAVNGVIPNTALRHEVQSAIKKEADELTGGLKNGDTYGIPVVPEEFMGADHPVIPKNVIEYTDQIAAESNLQVNPEVEASQKQVQNTTTPQ